MKHELNKNQTKLQIKVPIANALNILITDYKHYRQFQIVNNQIMKENTSNQLMISMKNMSPLILSPGNLKESVANTLDSSFVSQFSIAEQSKENINNQNAVQVFRKERVNDRIAVFKLVQKDIQQTEKYENPRDWIQSLDEPIQMISFQVAEQKILNQINNSGNSEKQIGEISNEGIIKKESQHNIFNQNHKNNEKLNDEMKNNGILQVDSKVNTIRESNRAQSFLRQKELARKQKEEVKRQYEQRYNKLWSQSIRKDHTIIRLELSNNDLQKQVRERNEQLEQLKKGSKRQLQLLKKELQTEINELIAKNKQSQENIKQSYQQKQKFLTDKCELLQEECRRINDEKESLETRYRKKLEEITQDEIQLARRVKECMERKIQIVQERHQSQLQALRQQHRLQCQIIQSQLADYKVLLQSKTQIIGQQSTLIQGLSPLNLSKQSVSLVDDLSQNQQIKSKDIQLCLFIKFIAVKLQEQKERQIQIIQQKYEGKLKKLEEKNIEMEKKMEEMQKRLRMRFNAAQMAKISQIEINKGTQINKIHWSSENKFNYQQKQQESNEEKQQIRFPLKSLSEGPNQDQCELLKKDLALTKTQLSLCRQQLSLYQSIIESLQLQLSQLQSSNKQLSQKNDELTNLFEQNKKEPFADENISEINLSRNHWNRQESLFVKSIQEQLNCKYHQLQLTYVELQDQYFRTTSELQKLKKQSFQTQVEHQTLKQSYQQIKNQVVRLQKSEDQTKDFIAELKEINQWSINQTKNSYDRLLLQRQQEVQQLSLIIGQVIKQNFEIRRSYNFLKHEIERKKQYFNEDNKSHEEINEDAIDNLIA